MDSNHGSRRQQIYSLPHLAALEISHIKNTAVKNGWSWWTDSNPRPADYKSAALPTELHQRISLCVMRDNADDYTYIFSACQHFFIT